MHWTLRQAAGDCCFSLCGTCGKHFPHIESFSAPNLCALQNEENMISMKDPTSKAELLQAIYTARNDWDTLIAQIAPHQLSDPVAPGSWSIKDIIAHITEYDRWLALGLAMRLQKPPQIWLDDISLDEFNAILHQQIADRNPEDILLDSKQVFQDLINEVESHSEAYLFGTHRVEGVSYDVNPFQLEERILRPLPRSHPSYPSLVSFSSSGCDVAQLSNDILLTNSHPSNR
jgi:hypothetical protein